MSMLAGIFLTIAVYLAAKRLYRRSPGLLFSPLFVCPLILGTGLTLLNISYETYNTGGQLLSGMLQPAMVALAVPVYKYKSILKTYVTEILFSVTGGSVIAIVTSMGAAALLGMSPQMTSSLAPRSITTPMAINVAQQFGGDPSLTAILVIASGLTGVALTSALLKCGLTQNPVSRGMMLGSSAHGTGTARAYELGPLEGAISSLAMVFMGIVTTVIAPVLVPLLLARAQ